MRVLVTGGVGFIGTNLIKRLLSDGHKVVSFDNYSTGYKENEQDGCQYFTVDISKYVKDYSFFMDKIDVIFHMAALPRIKPSFENPTVTVNVNVQGTLNVLEFARNNNCSVIYAGSSSFHGGVYKNPYTFSKWQGEELCKMYEKIYGVDVSICRFYNVYGEYMINDGEYRTVLSIFKEQHENGKPLTITSDGKQRRDFTHVDDVVDAMIKCVEKKEYGHIFELGRGKNYSINEIADMFGKLSTKDKIYIDEIPGEVRETLCNSELAIDILGWKPKKDLGDWLRELGI